MGAALAPHSSWAIDLGTTPPPAGSSGTTSHTILTSTHAPYIAPNIIFSLDNSEFTKNQSITVGGKPLSAAAVMRDMVRNAILDTAALPDGSIRFTWQTMKNGCNSDATLGTMKELNAASRAEFANYLQRFDSCSWRSTSETVAGNAYRYLEDPLIPSGPWAYKPGEQGAPYLGCRRNYHFMLSGKTYQGSLFDKPTSTEGNSLQADIRWRLPDDKVYTGRLTAEYRKANQHTKNQFNVYGGDHFTGTGRIADWAFHSWRRLQYFKPKYYPLDISITGGPVGGYPPAVTLEGELPLPADYVSAPATETIKNRVTGTSVTLEKYWNPRYNPAIWSHLVTYTFGLGTYGAPRYAFYYPPPPTPSGFAQPPVVNKAVQPTSMSPYGTDGDFAEYATGKYTWSSNDYDYYAWQLPELHTKGFWPADSAQELWHSAINSRGKYYVVHKGNEVADALRTVVAQAESDFGGSASTATSMTVTTAGTPTPGAAATAVMSGATTSGENIARKPVTLFKTYYDPAASWSGWVTGETLAADATGTLKTTAISGWQNKNTGQLLNDRSKATIFTRNVIGWRDANGTQPAGSIYFMWRSDGTGLSPAHRAALAGDDNRGEARLDYITGARNNEGPLYMLGAISKGGGFRVRKSVLGDIANSQIWYTGAPTANSALPGYAQFYADRKDRTPMLYVGANDGMLHGFSALDGNEKIAYVPRGVVPQLIHLTDPGYDGNHRYFVDGSPMTGDAQVTETSATMGTTSTSWQTILVGTLGAGGKGYFILNVTNPGTDPERFTSGKAIMDKTLAPDEGRTCASAAAAPGQISCLTLPEADLGHITAAPVRDDNNPLRASQITRMNNDRWAVVLGNGYNSTNQRPVLLVQYLDGDKELLRIPATGGTSTGAHANTTDNGLAAPRLVDIDGDGRPDVAYAGDNKGNLWKFMLASRNPAEWGVAFDGSPLYTAVGPAAANGARTLPQPISTAPIVRANDRVKTVGSGTSATNVAVGGMMVAFGTGRGVARTDAADTTIQSLYGVLDNTRYAYTGTGTDKRLKVQAACPSCDDGKAVEGAAAVGSGVAGLARQTIGSTLINGKDGRQFWTVDPPTGTTAGQPTVNWATQKGWYLDLPVQGERLLKNMEFYDATNLLAVYSQAPSAAPTTTTERGPCGPVTVTSTAKTNQYLTVINLVDGARPQVQLMDVNNDGLFNATDATVSRASLIPGPPVAVNTGHQSKAIMNADGRVDKLARVPTVILRPSWRHLQ